MKQKYHANQPPTAPLAPPNQDLMELDPIPEDNSVSAAVAASRSAQQRNNERPGSSPSLLQDASEVSGGSDVNNLMYGAQETQSRQQERKPRPSLCNQRVRMFTLFLVLLLVGIGAGIHFIVQAIDDDDDDEGNKQNALRQPTVAPTFPTFDSLFMNDDGVPTMVPTYSPVQMQSIDNVLYQLTAETRLSVAPNTIDLNDPSTPHGNCRLWLIQSDEMDLNLDPLTGQPRDVERIQQRYILCLLFEQMNGPNWQLGNGTGTFKDKTAHECTWEGVTCNGFDYVAVLDLWNKNLAGSIPEEITSLEKLQVLRLSNNTLVGTIPERLLDLPDLLWLDLSSNQLTGSVVSSTASQSALLTLYLNYNSLEGTIPYFSKLTSLRLHGNRFSELNEGYTTSESLKRLVAYQNGFTGIFPQNWNSPNLMHLDLGLNAWKGSIPQSLWDNTPKLEYLLLNDGRLKGTLPSTTASPNLSYVWLQSNQLTGTVPETFGQNWLNLTSLQLQGNDLRGSMPTRCSQWQAQVIQVDCSLVNCPCCTSCS